MPFDNFDTAIITRKALNGLIIVVCHLTLSMVAELPAQQHSIAQPEVCANCEPNQIWLVSARDIVCTDQPHISEFVVESHQACSWLKSSFTEMQTTAPASVPTMVYIHGYQTDLAFAKKRGLQVYQKLFWWMWPIASGSFSSFGLGSQNVIVGERCPTTCLNRNLQWHLEKSFALSMNEISTGPTLVFGYSLGAQVAFAGLAGCELYQGHTVELAVIAAANRCHSTACNPWSLCNGCESRVNRTTIFSNPNDRAIRASNLICRVREGRDFMNFEAMAMAVNQSLGQIEIIDLICDASRSHSINRYTKIPIVRSQLHRILIEAMNKGDQSPLGIDPVN